MKSIISIVWATDEYAVIELDWTRLTFLRALRVQFQFLRKEFLYLVCFDLWDSRVHWSKSSLQEITDQLEFDGHYFFMEEPSYIGECVEAEMGTLRVFEDGVVWRAYLKEANCEVETELIPFEKLRALKGMT